MYIGHELQVSKSGYRIIDDISSSFNGSTTSFALTVGGASPVPFPINTQQIYISVNGVLQEPDPTGSAGFKLLGTNIVFSSAPANGHAFFGVILAGADYVTVGTEFPAGSATSPSITFGTDNNTGLYSVTSGTMGFSSDGVQTFSLDGDGFKFNDNKKLIAGTASDLQIYHDGTDSRIKNTTGNLIIADTNGIVAIQGKQGEESITCAADGAVTLYYDNGIKLATTSGGINVTGTVTDDGGTHDGDVTFTGAANNAYWEKSNNRFKFTDNAQAAFGTSSDLQLFHNGTRSKIQNNTGDLRICSDAIQIKNYDDDETYITCTDDGAVELYHNNVKTIATSANGATFTGAEGYSCELYISADEGDDNADKWRINALSSGSVFQIGNYNNGSGWDTSIECNGDGNVELYHDNSKKLETYSGGINITGYANLTDSQQIRLGTGFDLKMWHDGTHSFLTNDTGYLLISNLANNDSILRSVRDVFLQPAAGEQGVIARANGSVEVYYNNAKKFETKNYGVRFYGTLEGVDNEKVQLGSSGDLQIFHNGSASYIQDVGTGNLVLSASDGIIFQNGATTETLARFYENGACELYHNNSKKIETNSTGVTVDTYITLGGTGGIRSDSAIVFEDAGGNEWRAKFHDNAQCEFAYDNAKKLETTSAGATITGNAVATSKFRGNDNVTLSLGDSEDLQIYHSGSHSFIKDGGTGNLQLWTNQLSLLNAAGDESMIQALENGEVQLYHNNELKIKTTSTGGMIAGTSSANVLSIRNTTLGNGVVGILFSTQNHSGGREKAALFHQETHGGAHYGGDLVVCLNGAQGGATQVSISDRRATFKKDGGLCFNADTAYDNALDDYEQGTWTPSYVNFTNAGNSTGRAKWYTKIGNVVTLWWDCFQDSNNMSTSGDEYISGIPFTPASTGFFPIYCVGFYSNGSMFNMVGYLDHGSNPYIRIKTSASNFRHMWGSVTFRI